MQNMLRNIMLKSIQLMVVKNKLLAALI
jgi:hypothetical protein